jgi:hypothetical protein
MPHRLPTLRGRHQEVQFTAFFYIYVIRTDPRRKRRHMSKNVFCNHFLMLEVLEVVCLWVL